MILVPSRPGKIQVHQIQCLCFNQHNHKKKCESNWPTRRKSSPWKSLLSGVTRNLCTITSCCETPTKGALKKMGVEHRIFPFQAIYWFNIFIPSIDFNSSQEKKKKGTKQFSSQTHTHTQNGESNVCNGAWIRFPPVTCFRQNSMFANYIQSLPFDGKKCRCRCRCRKKRTSNNCLWWLKNKTECWHSNIVNQFISMLSVASFDRTDTTFIPYLFFNFEFPFSIPSRPTFNTKTTTI